ncbi:MAG: hypothetical protein ACLTDX_09345 [[Clostridium] innocuum]
MSDEEVAACIRKSLLEHQQLLAHCNGDAAAEQYLTQFEKVVRELDAGIPSSCHDSRTAGCKRNSCGTDEAAAEVIPARSLRHACGNWG